MSAPLKWRPRTRADMLREVAAEHLAARMSRGRSGEKVSPEPASPDGHYMREACACGRRVPVFELVDATAVPEFPGDFACGACREHLARLGVFGTADWAERLGAPDEIVARLRAKDQRIQGAS